MAAPTRRTRSNRRLTALAASLALALVAVLVAPGAADAADDPVGLGAASTFVVLGHEKLTNAGTSVIVGDVGLSPGSEVEGYSSAVITGGSIHVSDGPANQAMAAAGTAYLDAQGRSRGNDVVADLGGQTLVPGVYGTDSSLGLTGTLTLDAKDDPAAVFVFQAGSTLITAPGSRVVLINGANPCNVTWQVGSSATLDVGSSFIGTILALTTVTLATGASVDGRVLALNGSVTLDTNVITTPVCAGAPSSTTTTGAPSSTTAGPTSTTEAPTPTTAGPTSTTAPTTSTTEAPTPTTAGPTSTTEVPTPTTAGPTSTTEVPTPTTSAPTTTTEVPSPTTVAPTTTTELPAPTTTEAGPVTTAAPVPTTEAPTTTAPAPSTTMPGPVWTLGTGSGGPGSAPTTTTPSGTGTQLETGSTTTIPTAALGSTTVPGATTGTVATPEITTTTLARTGGDPVRPAVAGTLAVLLGLVLVAGARRRLAA